MSSNEIRIHKTLARCGILAVVLLATLCRCARQAAPQGGPRDSLPPKVVTMTPAFGTTHFKDKRILIEFDEYVQLEDQQKEFSPRLSWNRSPCSRFAGGASRSI